jgi:cyclopropane-fatty-acyl-phospholipid synthase
MKHGLFKKLFFQALRGLSEGHLEIVCPEDTYVFGTPGSQLKAMVVVHHQRFFRRALFGGDIGLGEAFMHGDWSSPDLVAVVRLAVRNLDRLEQGSRLFSVLSSVVDAIGHRFRKNTVSGSRSNIGYHYDLGNDFYRLFLDPTMAYSCAYYETHRDSLEQAQLRKFDLICRKLQLSPSDRLLEIGTGWGGFAAYAAKHFGCRITTTTISRQQYEYARSLFDQLGEAGRRITLLLEDYRNLQGQFDKLVSIEMFEAVGLRYYDTYFGACDRLLKPDGLMFLQTITMNEQTFPAYHKRSDWIKKYIFPGAELASLAEVLSSLGRCARLSLHHAEDIGLHYAETLKAWRERFLARSAQVKALGFDDTFLRTWDYYLAYCEGAFREGYIGDIQMVLRKQNARLPLSWNAVGSENRREKGLLEGPEALERLARLAKHGRYNDSIIEDARRKLEAKP